MFISFVGRLQGFLCAVALTAFAFAPCRADDKEPLTVRQYATRYAAACAKMDAAQSRVDDAPTDTSRLLAESDLKKATARLHDALRDLTDVPVIVQGMVVRIDRTDSAGVVTEDGTGEIHEVLVTLGNDVFITVGVDRKADWSALKVRDKVKLVGKADAPIYPPPGGDYRPSLHDGNLKGK